MELLRSAAGVEHLGVRLPTSPASGGQGDSNASAAGGGASGGAGSAAGGRGGGPLTAAQIELVFRNESAPFLPALKELMYVYRTGRQRQRGGFCYLLLYV